MKRTIRLNESELKRMISESVKKVLNEEQWDKDTSENYGKLPIDGYHKFEDILNTWTPCNKELDNIFGDIESIQYSIAEAYTKLLKRNYNRSAGLIMNIMKNIDKSIGAFSMLPELIEEDTYSNNNGGQSLSDYNNRKAQWNFNQGEVDNFVD